MEVSGGIQNFNRKYSRQPPRRLVLISVDASAEPEPKMDESNKQPSLEETIGAMSDVQLHRYNVATIELMQRSLKRWAQALSTPGNPVEPYFIQINSKEIQEPERRKFFNQTPTSFRLSHEPMDRLIEAGSEPLRNNPESSRRLGSGSVAALTPRQGPVTALEGGPPAGLGDYHRLRHLPVGALPWTRTGKLNFAHTTFGLKYWLRLRRVR